MWTPIRMIHHETSAATQAIPYCISGTDRATGVSRSRLYVDTLKGRLSSYLPIRDRVRGTSAGERKIRQARALLQRIDQRKECLFVHRLCGSSNISVTVL